MREIQRNLPDRGAVLWGLWTTTHSNATPASTAIHAQGQPKIFRLVAGSAFRKLCAIPSAEGSAIRRIFKSADAPTAASRSCPPSPRFSRASSSLDTRGGY